MIINKDKVDLDLIHDINLELEALFESRTWEINADSWDFDTADTIQIIVKGKGPCYTSTISDVESLLWDLLNSSRDITSDSRFSTATSYYDPLKEAIVFEYQTYISLKMINI